MEPSRPTVSTLLLKRPTAATGSNSRCSTTRSSYLSRVALEEPLPPSLPPALKADWLQEDQVTRPGRVDRVVILQVLSQVSAARLPWRRPASQGGSIKGGAGEPPVVPRGHCNRQFISTAHKQGTGASLQQYILALQGWREGREWRGGVGAVYLFTHQ